MKNVKLFFKTLVSNNAAIDAGRKKPWYAALIIFLISIVLSVIPSTVLELNKQGNKNFEPYTYSAREALTMFSQDLKTNHSDQMIVIKNDKDSTLVANDTVSYTWNSDSVTFKFKYSSNEEAATLISAYNEEQVSYFIFTIDTVYIHIVNPNQHDQTVVNLVCLNAYKKVGERDIIDSYVSSDDETESVEKTWDNWKVLIKKLYNQTRLKSAGMQLAIMSAVNVGIILIMGFMVWVLTRGKNNPYRIFNVWECYKIVFWAGFTPALLTTGLGFLIKTFASTIFPLFLGVRVMWLSMKSLRPDGSGYAAD